MTVGPDEHTNPSGSGDARPAAAALLFDRRSTAALAAPGPSAGQLDVLVRAAATVPDHGNLRPWRLVIVEGEGRNAFGEALARSAADLRPGMEPDSLDRVRQKAFVAPAQVLIIASPNRDSKIEEWEQLATAACTGFAVALAAHAMGLGAIWKSVPFTRGVGLVDLLGLAEHEQLLGWVNVGTATKELGPRAPVDPTAYTTVVRADRATAYAATPTS